MKARRSCGWPVVPSRWSYERPKRPSADPAGRAGGRQPGALLRQAAELATVGLIAPLRCPLAPRGEPRAGRRRPQGPGLGRDSTACTQLGGAVVRESAERSYGNPRHLPRPSSTQALGRSGAARRACGTGRCGGCGSTGARARSERVPGRPVTTPHTVQSLIDQRRPAGRDRRARRAAQARAAPVPDVERGPRLRSIKAPRPGRGDRRRCRPAAAGSGLRCKSGRVLPRGRGDRLPRSPANRRDTRRPRRTAARCPSWLRRARAGVAVTAIPSRSGRPRRRGARDTPSSSPARRSASLTASVGTSSRSRRPTPRASGARGTTPPPASSSGTRLR